MKGAGAAILLLFLLGGAAPPAYDETGMASWYGDELAGRQTASGEAFDPQGLSAAHRTLPLGSYAEVSLVDSDRSVTVRINDRGPVGKAKLIDLSLGAARRLGIEAQGLALVRVRSLAALAQAAPAR